MGCQTQGTSVLWQWKRHKHLFIYSAHNGTVSRSFCFPSFLLPSCYPSSPLLFLSHCEMVIYFQWQAPLANKLLGSISASRFFSLNLSPSLRIRQQQHHLKLGRLSVEFSCPESSCCHLMILCQLVIHGQEHEETALLEHTLFEFYCSSLLIYCLTDVLLWYIF